MCGLELPYIDPITVFSHIKSCASIVTGVFNGACPTHIAFPLLRTECMVCTNGSNNNKIDPEDISEVASAFQEAVVDTLLRNTIKAIEKYDVKALILGGGVTANSLLREKAKAESPIPVIVPSPKLCTDNGAMIATAGYFESKGLEKNELHQWAMDAIPNLKLG